jgi:hypothetical protein
MPRNPRLKIAPGGVLAELARDRDKGAAQEPLPLLLPDSTEDEEQTRQDALRRRLEPKTMPGTRPSGKRVKWYHIVRGMACHAFTVPKQAHEDLANGNPLACGKAVFPDGTPVVPPGTPPWDVVIRCGTCGATEVRVEDLVFYLD